MQKIFVYTIPPKVCVYREEFLEAKKLMVKKHKKVAFQIKSKRSFSSEKNAYFIYHRFL